jgi:hypothetical protein
MTDTVTFKLKGGNWTYPIDPRDEEYFGIDLVDFCAPGVTPAGLATGAPADPTIILTDGLQALSAVRIQGTQLVVKLTGINPDPDGVNSCTFDFYTSTGEQFFRSIYFTRKDK